MSRRGLHPERHHNKQNTLRGWCSCRVLPEFGNLRNKIIFPRYMTWTCWDFLTTFHNKFRASCGRPQCVLPPFAETCSSISAIPITQSPPSPLSKPPPSSRLSVLFFVSCVMSIYQSIDPSVHFFSPGLLAANCCCCLRRLLYICYISSPTSQPNVYWLEEIVGPVA